MANRKDCVELGLVCVNVCEILRRGLDGRKLDQLSPSVFEAIGQLKM